jgi:hypothetical protein
MYHWGVQEWTGEAWVTVAKFTQRALAQLFVEAASDSLSHYQIVGI